MKNSLPEEQALDMAVLDFGLGNYDSLIYEFHGENKNELDRPSSIDSDPRPDPELLSSYASSALPGDTDRELPGKKPHPTNPRVLPSISNSKLPNDDEEASARSDYYDKTSISSKGFDTYWADDDSGVYAENKENKNEVKFDNGTRGIGNAWSGYVVEDITDTKGFPSTNLMENVDYPSSNNDGSVVAKSSKMKKVATNIELITSLSKKFLSVYGKKYGRKNLTRRHIMKFLTDSKESQYFASDMIRCIRLLNDVYIKDVLDEFPVSKQSSKVPEMNNIEKNLIDTIMLYKHDKVSFDLSQILKNVSYTFGLVEKSRRNRG